MAGNGGKVLYSEVIANQSWLRENDIQSTRVFLKLGMNDQESESRHPNKKPQFFDQFLILSQFLDLDPPGWRRGWVSRRKEPAALWQVNLIRISPARFTWITGHWGKDSPKHFEGH